MKFHIRVFLIGLISLIIVVIFYSLYNYMSQLETPLWVIQYTFYAFMTAIFGFIFLGILAPLIRDYLKEAKVKKIEEKKALESLKKEYERCAWSIKNNIEKDIEKNELTTFEARLYNSEVSEKVKVSEELKRQVQEYAEKCKLYTVLRMSSEWFIKSTIEAEVKRKFPKTLKKPYELDSILLQSNFLMARYLNGEKVNESWFKGTQPIALKNMIKNIDESERSELDTFFLEINNEFEKNSVLQRFRKEKEELIKHGRETIANLQKEIGSINEQLNKYSNLRIGKEEEKL